MIFIGLGANLPSKYGPPLITLKAALEMLPDKGVRVDRVSRFWRTAPVPVSNQPDFINAVACLDYKGGAEDLLKILQDLEHEFGRVRNEKNAPRCLDLDILDFRSEIVEIASLSVPHPRMAERAFVLYPLQELAPDWTHPVSGAHITHLIKTLPEDQNADPVHMEVL